MKKYALILLGFVLTHSNLQAELQLVTKYPKGVHLYADEKVKLVINGGWRNSNQGGYDLYPTLAKTKNGVCLIEFKKQRPMRKNVERAIKGSTKFVGTQVEYVLKAKNQSGKLSYQLCRPKGKPCLRTLQETSGMAGNDTVAGLFSNMFSGHSGKEIVTQRQRHLKEALQRMDCWKAQKTRTSKREVRPWQPIVRPAQKTNGIAR